MSRPPKKSPKRSSKRLTPDEQDEVSQLFPKNEGQSIYDKIKVNFKCKTENQKKLAQQIRTKEISIGAGFAGVGKSYVSIGEALQLLKTRPEYRRIILVKSVVELKGESLGFLKGELDEKLRPYIESFKDSFNKIIGAPLTEELFKQGIIKVEPLSFIRGRTIDNAIIIIDEAQNISYDNMKTILTRIGENSKIVVIGDTKQIDLKEKKQSCLKWLTEQFEKNPIFGVTVFTKEDQVRNPIITIIEDMFDELDKPKPKTND